MNVSDSDWQWTWHSLLDLNFWRVVRRCEGRFCWCILISGSGWGFRLGVKFKYCRECSKKEVISKDPNLELKWTWHPLLFLKFRWKVCWGSDILVIVVQVWWFGEVKSPVVWYRWVYTKGLLRESFEMVCKPTVLKGCLEWIHGQIFYRQGNDLEGVQRGLD